MADRFGGRTTPGSGNTWSRKNDVRNDTTSFEMKYTGKKQYTLKAAELEQGEKHAIMDGRYFVFGVEMAGRNWIVLSEEDYAELTSPKNLSDFVEVEHWTRDGRTAVLEVLNGSEVRCSVEILHGMLQELGFEQTHGA